MKKWFMFSCSLAFSGYMLTPSYAHDDVFRTCFNVMPTLITEVIMENGTVAEGYDLNGDGKLDAVVYSSPLSVSEHSRLPTFYELDLDGDNEPDALYVDIRGEGKCSDILLYMDYNEPGHLKQHEPNTQQKARH